MSQQFTEYSENDVLWVYGSTDRYMRFALERLDLKYVPISEFDGIARPLGHQHMTTEGDLLPIELKGLDYRPADKLMRDWIRVFFSNKSRNGLIPTLYWGSGRKYYNPDLPGWEFRRSNAGRMYGVVESYYASSVRSIRTMYEFLTWFPDDTGWLEECRKWADAFKQVNEGPNGYGHHCYKSGGHGCMLYDVVNTGPAAVSKTYLFGVGLEYISALDVGSLSTELVNEFEAHGCVLSLQAQVEVEQAGSKWKIVDVDNRNTYFVRLEDQTLYIYPEIKDNPAEWPELEGLTDKILAKLAQEIGSNLTAEQILREPTRAILQDLTTLMAQNLDAMFDTYFQFAMEGLPDSLVVMAQDYSTVARAFVLLTQLLTQKAEEDYPDDALARDSAKAAAAEYAEFAAVINGGLWNARLNPDTYLMPSTVTPLGPLPGDTGGAGQVAHYQSDTDCLYWALGLFKAYRLAGPAQPDFRPDPAVDQLHSFRGRTRLRRELLAKLLEADSRDKFLGMALGLTLDWIRYGWKSKWGHFVSKIHHDGTPSTDGLIDDGMYNTLQILIEAYRNTHDPFYLEIFDLVWAKLKSVAETVTKSGTLLSQFPGEFWRGSGEKRSPQNGDSFLDIILDAYQATVEAAKPCQGYIDDAVAVADAFLDERGPDGKQLKSSGISFLRLALAQGTLRRIEFSIWEETLCLEFTQGNSVSTVERWRESQVEARKPFIRAVVYMDAVDMDKGKYKVRYVRGNGDWSCASDQAPELEIGATTVSVEILQGGELSVRAEGDA